jgi:hypothetical protein
MRGVFFKIVVKGFLLSLKIQKLALLQKILYFCSVKMKDKALHLTGGLTSLISAKLFTLVFFCALFGINSLKCQQFRAFSPDGTIFSEEAKQFFLTDRNADRRQQANAAKLVDEFMPLFDMLIDSEQRAFLAMCNAALRTNMRPFPTFENLLKSIVNFFNDGQFAKSFNNYIKALNTIAENRKIRDFDLLIESTNRLFETGFLYESLSVRWKTDGESLFEYFDEKPRFVFLRTNLIGYANSDSTKIHFTQGAFYPLTQTWQGKSGLVDFSRAGFDVSEMFIQLGSYEINLRTSRYQADSVNFFNKIYFEKPLFGRLEERVLANVRTETASYPTFVSYDNSLVIENIFDNVDFEGQYTQVGGRVRSGGKNDLATLRFRKNNQTILTVSAKNFLFGKQRISTPMAEVRIPLGDGEILHSTAEVRFDNSRRELSVLHPNLNAFKNPIHNSYHEIDMHVEAIYWTIDSVFMDFRMLRIPNNEGIGIFESKNFFSEQDMQLLMQQIDYNPFFLLRKMSEQFQSRTLRIASIADFFRQDITQIRVMLLRMASMGFLRYDAEKEDVELQQKLFHYLQSSAKRSDFDVFRITSKQVDSPNARLNLETHDFQIFGIDQIFLSLVQNVYVVPDGQTITMKKNRDFEFDGKIHSGKFDFVAERCYFDYDRFTISMDIIQSMEFSVKYGQPDFYGNFQLQKVGTTIEELTGIIFIDSATNRSGKEWYRHFPVFESFQNSYVRYEKPNIQNGVYFADQFYFTIYPFRLENLNNFETDSLRFDGDLTSAGIFPTIYEKLKVMPDFSLGFTTLPPENFWQIYENRGEFYDTLHLSNDGLIGNGRLDFQTSTNYSNRIIFMPDSTNAIFQTFDVEAQSMGPEFPSAQGKTARLHWQPYENSFSVTNRRDGFSVFDDELKFFGELILSDEGMVGNGTAIFKNKTEMSSENFVIKNKDLFSDSVKFALKSKDGQHTAIQSENYMVHVDFDGQRGYFESNNPEVFLQFPLIRYLCFMNELEWDMKSNHVYLKNSEKSSYSNEELDRMNLRELIAIGDDLPGSEFISLHPRQDSLTFISPLAEYNLETNELSIQQVRIIYVADIAVQPNEGSIVIGKDSYIKPFEKSNVLVDVHNQYFDIFNAEISIQGRTRYTANGTYNYIDVDDEIFPIYFEKLTPDRNGTTTATARITIEDEFSLSPAFGFYGQATLKATEPFLSFSGNSKVNYICEEDERSWFSINTSINPKNVEIPITGQPQNRSTRREGAGFYLSGQGDLFPSFLTQLKSTDRVVLNKTGTLFFDAEQKAYIIEPKEKANENDLLIQNTSDCTLKLHGTPDFNLNLGRVIWDNFGILQHNYRDNSTLFDAVIGMKFFFDEKALKILTESLELGDAGAEQNTDKFVDFIYSKLPGREAERLEREIETFGSVRRIPSNLEQTILFSDVKLLWDEKSRSFVSIGKLGIAAIGQTQINKYINGTLQVLKSRRGDVINLYLEISRREWYFFSYSDGLMQVIASEPDFNDLITAQKASKRKQKGGEGKGRYEFGISTIRRKNDFVSRVNAIRENLDETDEEDDDSLRGKHLLQEEDDDASTPVSKPEEEEEVCEECGKISEECYCQRCEDCGKLIKKCTCVEE